MQIISAQRTHQNQGDIEKTAAEAAARFQTKDAAENVETPWNEEFLVTFSPDDPENPLNWSNKLKWGVTTAIASTGFIRIMVSTMMAPAIETIAKELHMTAIESTMALSVYVLATALGPMVIGPLSEVYGRKSIFHVTNIWFLAWNLICGFAHSKGLLIAARFLAGFGASAVFSLAYGVLGDVWPPERRGRSLSLYLLIPLTGGAVGPIIGGFIVQYSTWRWMFWSTAVFQGVLELSSLTVFYESYAPVLLRRRAEKRRQETGDSRYYAEIEKRESGRSTAWKIQRSLTRPFRLLMFHSIIQMEAILEGINYGLLYFTLSSFSTLYVNAYGESIAISGLHYIAICLGELIGSQVCGPVMDYLFTRLKSRDGSTRVPELRIPLMLPSALLTPIGFLLYGWSARYHLFWLVLDIGAVLLALGMQVFDTTLRAYVMDAYAEHISSASAATQVLKSLLAFAFPLFSDSMYKALGYGWGNSLLAFLSIGITVPSICILWYFGARLRARLPSSY
ncbi:probable efflux pump mfs2 [Trichoderma asperellum]|uniref:Probable efflux pump mfs2 n=1 Tax=Trichoderma asperellum TaxID=101201 RepID=A0A6V8QI54_TRIAP|nr:MFS general substrate transporter [Trichoderma asperelloides]GFP52154.1 probable efflux pump mfs2 [Trichoderma asperellum]